MPVSREQLRKLADPFPPGDVEWRIQTSGDKNGKPWARVLAYVTNRAIQQRLDDVAGPENWQDRFHTGPDGGVVCEIGIYCERGEGQAPEWIWKQDGAENTDIEKVKGGLSNAEKRCGAKWGIGRYLYNLEEGFARVHEGGRFFAKLKSGASFRWDPPTLPTWALPGGSGDPDREPAAAPVAADAPHRAAQAPTAEGGADAAPRPAPTAAPPAAPNGTGGATCPKCDGPMWDNRERKTNPKAPDFKCKDKACDGVIWPAKGGRDATGANLTPKPDPWTKQVPATAPGQFRGLRGKTLGEGSIADLTDALTYVRSRGMNGWADAIAEVLDRKREQGEPVPAATAGGEDEEIPF
jgi:hypothetical protein